MPNVVRVALFDEVVNSLEEFNIEQSCSVLNLISLVASSREQVDYDVWQLMGNKRIEIQKKNFPNEDFRRKNWVGAEHYDAALLEDFLNSFYALLPWDDWFNPNFLDDFLINISKKPTNLLYRSLQISNLYSNQGYRMADKLSKDAFPSTRKSSKS